MARLLSHEDINARGSRKLSRTQRWRDVKAKLFPGPVDGGLANAWPESDIDYYDELIAAGVDRKTATAMVEGRRAEKRIRLINSQAGVRMTSGPDAT
jgi:hypothetical protein